MRKVLFCAGLLILPAVVQPLLAQQVSTSSFVVIVSSGNPTESLSRDRVSELFLKKVSQWEDGSEVEPVDLMASSEIRKGFSAAIHGRGVTAIKSYWQRLIFSGRAVPPPEKGSESEVLEFVGSRPGAIGYVSGDTVLSDDVKVLAVTD